MVAKPNQLSDEVVASVVIPTYNRKISLLKTLATLAKQTISHAHFEVIVVDDGSSDGTADVTSCSYPYPLRYLRQANQGSACARNTGANAATGHILIFLDDDMLVEPEYIEGLVDEHHNFPRTVAMGQELPFVWPDTIPFANMHMRIIEQNVAASGTFVTFTDCVTNNLSVERHDFLKIGMMHDVAGDGPTWWGDVEFGYRAHRLGFRFRRSAVAKCYHCDYAIRDLDTASQRAYRVAKMAVILFQKFPEIQPFLPMFVDKTPVKWDTDSPRLVIRKLLRQIASSRPMVLIMEQCARLLERYYPSSKMLELLYRWIVGSYHFRGYRAGLCQYGPRTEAMQV